MQHEKESVTRSPGVDIKEVAIDGGALFLVLPAGFSYNCELHCEKMERGMDDHVCNRTRY